MSLDGNSDSQKGRKNTGIDKYVHKYKKNYTYIQRIIITYDSLTDIQIFKENIIYFIVGFTTI